MPRLPRFKTPLRLLREALGKSQKEFSSFLEAKLDLPPSTYKSYEEGIRPVPEWLATELMILTGVEPTSIMSDSGKPRSLRGTKYSKADVDLISSREAAYSPEMIVDIITQLTDRYLIVLLAAQKAKQFTRILYSFERAVQQATKDLKLLPHIKKLLPDGEQWTAWKGIKIGLAGNPQRYPPVRLLPDEDKRVAALLNLIKGNETKKVKKS